MSISSSACTSTPNSLMAEMPSSKHLSLSQQIAYALPAISVGVLLNLMGIAQGIYAKYFGLALTTIATVILAARLFDVVTDLLIGYFSDRQYARTGSRKPFVFWGCLLFLVSSYFLFIPLTPTQLDVSAEVGVVYFLCWSLLFYLAFTLFEIPHQSWGAALASTSEEKNTIFSWRMAASSLGLILFSLVPFLPIFETREFTPETLRWSVYLVAPLLVFSLYLCLKKAPNPIAAHTSQKSYRIEWLTLLHNKPMLLFFAAYLFYGTGAGILFGVLFIYIDGYLGLGEHFSLMLIVGTVVGLGSVAIWRKVANQFGKKMVWIAGKVFLCIGALGLVLLSRGDAAFLDILWPYIIFQLGIVAGGIAAPSLLSDLIDYSNWKFKTECTASYYGLYTLMVKAFMALGSALGIMIFGWYGFDPAAPVYTADTIFVVQLSLGWLPILLFLLAILFLWLIPINAQRHRIIRQRLDAIVLRATLSEDQKRSINRSMDDNLDGKVFQST